MDGVGRLAVGAGQDGGLRRALDQRVDSFDRRELLEVPDVALHERDPGSVQARQVELGAAPVEVVVGDELPIGMALGEGDAEVGAHEAGTPCDQDTHRGREVNHSAPRRVTAVFCHHARCARP